MARDLLSTRDMKKLSAIQIHLVTLILTLCWCSTGVAQERQRGLARNLEKLYQQKVRGITRPHSNVVKQIRTAAGGQMRGKVYVVRYGSKAAEKLTAMMKDNGLGMIYKGSAWTGHNMAWIGGKFTDSVPGNKSFRDGSKTRWHDFKPQAERPQLVAAFELPDKIVSKAVDSAAKMARDKKQCGADCAGYVREILNNTSNMAQKVGATTGIAGLGKHLKTYLAPTPLRNASLREADAVILMTAKDDWRKPEHESYSIGDWNGK